MSKLKENENEEDEFRSDVGYIGKNRGYEWTYKVICEAITKTTVLRDAIRNWGKKVV